MYKYLTFLTRFINCSRTYALIKSNRFYHCLREILPTLDTLLFQELQQLLNGCNITARSFLTTYYIQSPSSGHIFGGRFLPNPMFMFFFSRSWSSLHFWSGANYESKFKLKIGIRPDGGPCIHTVFYIRHWKILTRFVF